MKPEQQKVHIIAAIDRNRGIGKNGELLFHIPEDLKRFKEITNGHTVIMGRKTWESLPEKNRPLPNRTNMVLTKNTSYEAPGAIVVPTLQDALAVSPTEKDIFVIGGASVYEEALPLADTLHLTHIDAEKDADVFFPSYEEVFPILKEDGNGLYEDTPFQFKIHTRS